MGNLALEEYREMLNPKDYEGDLKTVVIVFSEAMTTLVHSVDDIKKTLAAGFKDIKQNHATIKDHEYMADRLSAQSRRIDKVEVDLSKLYKIESNSERLDKVESNVTWVVRTIIAIVVAVLVGVKTLV